MKNSLLYPIQCTGCPAMWSDSYVSQFKGGSLEKLQENHRRAYKWEAWRHIIVDIRVPMDLRALNLRVLAPPHKIRTMFLDMLTDLGQDYEGG